jgi:hypothetical protein
VGFGLVARGRDGSIELRLDEEVRELLADVLGQLRDALLADVEDPLLGRLFPPAYADDPEKEAGFRALARDELLESRLAAIDAVEGSIDAERLDPEQAEAWVRALNALRLVLGTRLDIRQDDERRLGDPADPDAPAWVLYELLSALVDDLVTSLS